MKKIKQPEFDLVKLLGQFDDAAENIDLREKVLALIPVWDELRALGISLIPNNLAKAARDRILYYFQKYPKTVISHRELMIISGISEWARRVRELKTEYGWAIISGRTAKEMYDTENFPAEKEFPDLSCMGSDDYIMFDIRQDRESAFRWKLANEIRKNRNGAKVSILEFLKKNVGKPVTGEELRYVAHDKSEWARRVRELRTEEGWSISTYWNGRPELPIGTYLLESERQQPVHDRKIDDSIRRKVLVRDNYTCDDCRWSPKQWNKSDPRYLELHHIKQHVDGGINEAENLVVLCNVCHDKMHKKQ